MMRPLLAVLALVAFGGLSAGPVGAQGLATGARSMASPPPVTAPPVRRPTTATSSAPAAEAASPSSPGAPASPPTALSDEKTYVLGPSDVVEVSVLGRTDYTTKTRIDENGNIQLQFLGTVKAAGRTTEQLSTEIAQALQKGGYFANPVVQVNIASYASRYVTVLGNFMSPGLVPVDRAYRLSEIIARVGGVKDGGATYVILRPRTGAERRILVSTLATGDLNDDPYVSPGDKIYSPPADLVYVSGQVKTPGAFAILPDMTVRMALSRAGGLTDSGSDKRVTITRKGKKLQHVNLDGQIQSGDVIVVGERLF